jgi:hypothetical protein
MNALGMEGVLQVYRAVCTHSRYVAIIPSLLVPVPTKTQALTRYLRALGGPCIYLLQLQPT